jgi:hypothetical protein
MSSSKISKLSSFRSMTSSKDPSVMSMQIGGDIFFEGPFLADVEAIVDDDDDDERFLSSLFSNIWH